MTTGLSTTAVANAWLNVIGNKTTFTAPAASFVELHTADPGAAGTTAVANSSTRIAITMGAAATGVITNTSSPAFTGTATETITHIAVWSAVTAGTFMYSGALTASKLINLGDTLTINTHTVTLTPLAA